MTLTPEEIEELIKTDARIYLRNTERYRFTDGVAGDTGPYIFGKDYELGDIVGILDEASGQVQPVRVAEIVIVVEAGSTKFIPTLSAYAERDPEEQ